MVDNGNNGWLAVIQANQWWSLVLLRAYSLGLNGKFDGWSTCITQVDPTDVNIPTSGLTQG